MSHTTYPPLKNAKSSTMPPLLSKYTLHLTPFFQGFSFFCNFCAWPIFNKPGEAGAVLQTPLSFIHSLTQLVSQSVILCENIFKTPLIPNRESYGAEILREGSPSPTCHVSCVTCHMSHVMCHMSRVTCHVSPVTCHMSRVRIF